MVDTQQPDPSVQRALGIDRRGVFFRWLRRLIWLAVVFALVMGGMRLWRNLQTPAPISYRTQPVERGDLTRSVTATGTVQPVNVVDVGPEISGLVREVRVDFNDTVEANQVLAELDTELLEARLREARAQVAIARANQSQAQTTLDEARENLARLEGLTDRRVVTAREIDTAEFAVRRAEAALEMAEAQVRAAHALQRIAETNLEKASIRSPIDGVVLSRSVEVGQTVVSQLQAAVLFRIAEDLNHMELIADVDEADIGRVETGQVVRFTVSAYPDRHFEGQLESVRNAPTTLSNVVTYQAVVTVLNDDLALRPGMTATAQIITEVHPDRLLIPNAALRFTPPAEMGDGPLGGRPGMQPGQRPGQEGGMGPAQGQGPERRPGMGPGQGPGQRPGMRPGQGGPGGRRWQRPGAGTGEGTGDAPFGPRVWVLENGEPKPIPVRVGPTDGLRTVLEDGDLEEGAELLVDIEREEP